MLKITTGMLEGLLPEGVRLLDAAADEFDQVTRALRRLQGVRADNVHAGAGLCMSPSSSGFTLFRAVREGTGMRAVGYLTAAIDLSGRDVRTHVKMVFTDARHRGRRVASELADALAEISMLALMEEWRRWPEYGLPEHHLIYHAVSAGGARLCMSLDRKIHERACEARRHDIEQDNEIQDLEMAT